MKEIQLTSGYVAIVDDEDFELLASYRWSAAFNSELKKFPDNAMPVYAGGYKKGTNVLMHRLLMNAQHGQRVDHKDGNGLNNRRSNLRICTPTQNAFNTPKRKGCSSKHKGVFWNKQASRWQAGIYVNRKYQKLGLFTDEATAARAYDEAAKLHAGEFATLNFPALVN